MLVAWLTSIFFFFIYLYILLFRSFAAHFLINWNLIFHTTCFARNLHDFHAVCFSQIRANMVNLKQHIYTWSESRTIFFPRLLASIHICRRRWKRTTSSTSPTCLARASFRVRFIILYNSCGKIFRKSLTSFTSNIVYAWSSLVEAWEAEKKRKKII